jgi:nitrate/nitrite transport system ATP-binding protein
VVNTMPRGRTRGTVHHDPQYYRIRNHLVDFLVSRAKALAGGRAPPVPDVVTPGLSPEPDDTDPPNPEERAWTATPSQK